MHIYIYIYTTAACICVITTYHYFHCTTYIRTSSHSTFYHFNLFQTHLSYTQADTCSFQHVATFDKVNIRICKQLRIYSCIVRKPLIRPKGVKIFWIYRSRNYHRTTLGLGYANSNILWIGHRLQHLNSLTSVHLIPN